MNPEPSEGLVLIQHFLGSGKVSPRQVLGLVRENLAVRRSEKKGQQQQQQHQGTPQDDKIIIDLTSDDETEGAVDKPLRPVKREGQTRDEWEPPNRRACATIVMTSSNDGQDISALHSFGNLSVGVLQTPICSPDPYYFPETPPYEATTTAVPARPRLTTMTARKHGAPRRTWSPARNSTPTCDHGPPGPSQVSTANNDDDEYDLDSEYSPRSSPMHDNEDFVDDDTVPENAQVHVHHHYHYTT